MTDRDDALIHRDKFLGDKVDIKGHTGVVEKVLEVRHAVEAVASGAYPFPAPHGLRVPLGGHTRLAMAGNGSLIKGADELLILFRHSLVSSRVPNVAILGVADRGRSSLKLSAEEVSEQVEGQRKRLKDKGKAQKGAASFRKFTDSRNYSKTSPLHHPNEEAENYVHTLFKEISDARVAV
jgi:hypothetical protein